MTLVLHEKGLVLEGSRPLCLMWLEKMTNIFSQMVVEMVIDHGRIRKKNANQNKHKLEHVTSCMAKSLPVKISRLFVRTPEKI